LCSGYKNPEKKIKIPFWIKKSGIENNTFRKNLSEKDYCVPEEEIWNEILYLSISFKGIFPYDWLQ